MEIVRCKDCQHWIAPHVKLKDGRCRQYTETEKDENFDFPSVTSDIGTNVRGRCCVDYNCGYAEDKRVFRNEYDFCSRGKKLPCSYEQWRGIVDGFYPDKAVGME